jgi:hypothetical protein
VSVKKLSEEQATLMVGHTFLAVRRIKEMSKAWELLISAVD